MAFEYDINNKLKEKIRKLTKKDRHRAEILYKKINEIANSGNLEIDHYKNLRHDLSEMKRVHIDKSFVLTFKVEKKNNKIRFIDFDHHDNIYKK